MSLGRMLVRRVVAPLTVVLSSGAMRLGGGIVMLGCLGMGLLAPYHAPAKDWQQQTEAACSRITEFK